MGTQVGDIGVWAGIVAVAVVLVCLEIRRARGPLERRFILKSVPWVCGYVVIVGIMLRQYMPWFLHMPIYGAGLFLTALWFNKKQAVIRRKAAAEHQGSDWA